MRKFLIIGLSTMFLRLAACHGDDTPKDHLRKINPRDTPIVVTGGSIHIESDTPWIPQSDGSYTTTIVDEVKRISVTNKHSDNVEIDQDIARPDPRTFWTVHLVNLQGLGGTILATGTPTKSLSASAYSGSSWVPTADCKGLDFKNGSQDTLDRINVEITVNGHPTTIQTACHTNWDWKNGHCRIHLRTKDTKPEKET